jgi:hypothetical protein
MSFHTSSGTGTSGLNLRAETLSCTIRRNEFSRLALLATAAFRRSSLLAATAAAAAAADAAAAAAAASAAATGEETDEW